MTKNGRAVLMPSPATGPWFYVGSRACYWGLSAAPSNSNKKIPLRSPPPGFVSAFTLAHAICSWCQISSTSGARAEAKTCLDLGKHLEGHSCMRHLGLGRQGESWHSPTAHPMAPSRWHSSESHLQVQPGSAPSSTTPFLGRRIWVSEEARSPSYHWGPLRRARGMPDPATPHRAAPHDQPSWLPHQGKRGALVWWEGSLWGSLWEQVAYGADVGRKPSVSLN